MSKNTTIGICQLCSKHGELTFEHVPPRAAFNDKLIYIQNHEHLIEKSSYLYGKKNKSHRGFGGFTLCKTCNNNTGKWYAKDFVSFAHQGMKSLKSLPSPPYWVEGDYKIKPLNVLKQILTMFMSADKGGHLASQKDLVNYLLTTRSNHIPSRYKIFMYTTLSSHKRMLGISSSYDPELGIQVWAEINFQPFGYLLAENSDKAHRDMVDITKFSIYQYDEEINLRLRLPYLRVENPFIGLYA